MKRAVVMVIALLLVDSASSADYLLLLDTTRLDRALAVRGVGPDGRLVRPGAVAAVCRSHRVFGPAAFSPQRNTCQAAAAVPGLSEAIRGLRLADGATDSRVLDRVDAGGIVAVLPSRGLACTPGDCSRELFESAGYPTRLVGRPDPDPLPVPSIADFGVQPTGIVAGQTATLSWDAAGIAVCGLESSEVAGILTVPPSGQLQVSPGDDTVWTLTCAGPGGTAIEQVTATVTPAPGAPEIILFAASRDDVPIGARTRLIWETRSASACAISNGEQSLAVPIRGHIRVTVARDTLFELRCQNAAGSNTSSTEVLVTIAQQAPVISAFSIDRNTIARGNNAFLSWQAPGATRCRLRETNQNVVWRLPPSGQFKLIPASSTTYTLECRNALGSALAQSSITVEDSDEPLRIMSFSLEALGAAPAQGGGSNIPRLNSAGLVQVSWVTEGARACRISDDRGRVLGIPPSGSRIIHIEETTALQIICAARGAEAQALGQVEVIEEFLFADDFED